MDKQDYLKKEIQDFINKKESFNATEDCYCLLMKQIFLSKSGLN